MIKLLTSIKRFLPQRDNKRLLYTSAANCLVWAAFFLIVLSTPAWADEAFKRHCPTLNEYLTDGQGSNCLLCGIYRIVMAACAQVVTGSWNAFAAPLQGVVAVGASIYIAVYTLKNIASFSQQDSSVYLSNDKTGIIPLCVKVAAVVWLLSNQAFLYNNLIGPVIGAGMAIGQQIAPGGLGAGSFSGTSDVNALFNAVINKVQEFNDQVYIVVALGRMLLCLAFLPDSIIDWYWSLMPFGAVLYVFGWFILIGVAFYLLDVLFRLAVGCMLLPMAIACGVSKFTSSYTKKAWNLFVNVFFNFVMLGVLLQFTLQMILQAVAGNSEMQAQLAGTIPLNKADIDKIVEKLDVMSFILTTVCCMVCFKLFMEIEKLADKVSSSTSVGKLGKKAGAITAQVVKAPLSKINKEGGKFVKAARQQAWQETKDSKAGVAVRKAGRSTKQFVKKLVGLR